MRMSEEPNFFGRWPLEGIALIGLALWLMTGVEIKGQEVIAEKGNVLYQRLSTVCHGTG